jgi:PleD family two-component response regulator
MRSAATFANEKMKRNRVSAVEKSPCRILVADDELLIQRFVSQVLSGDGYDVTCVSSGD